MTTQTLAHFKNLSTRHLLITKKLFPWQVHALDRLQSIFEKHKVALDLSDCGTGKTYVAAAYCALMNIPPMIVCPKAVIGSWEAALEYFGVEPLEIINYEKLVRGSSMYARPVGRSDKKKGWMEFSLPEDAIVIFDEAHRCKGQNSLATNALMGARRSNVPKLLLLSATLAETPMDFKGIGYVTNLFSEYSGFWKWSYRYGCRAAKFGGLQCREPAPHMEKIREQLEPLTHRTRISDLGDAFPENFVSLWHITPENPSKLSKAMMGPYEKAIADGEVDNPLTLNLRARQLAELALVDSLVDQIIADTENDLDPVVFVNFRGTLDLLKGILANKDDGIRISQVSGDQDTTTRFQQIHQFQEPTIHGRRVMIVMTQAGGTGMSFHHVHPRANPRVSYILPPWSAREFIQCLGRIHRAGSLSKALQRIVVAKHTIMERVAKKLRGKLDAINTINDDDMNLFDDIPYYNQNRKIIESELLLCQ